MSTKRGSKTGAETAAPNGKPAGKTSSPANAWNRPLKAKTTSPPPGMGPADGSKNEKANGAEINTILRDRLLHLSLTLVGHKVTVTQTNGAVFEGIFHTFTPFPNLSAEMKNKYVLNAVKLVKPPTSGDDSIKDGSTVIIPAEKVLYIQATNVNLDRPLANGAGFNTSGKANNDVMTDTQISGKKMDKDRDLVAAGSAWTNAGSKSRADALGGSLEGGMSRKAFGTARPGGLKGKIGDWDQFKANEELFNVQATYDENLYTTELDKSQIDAKKIREAERLAKEIENTASTNLHVAEERGHVVETDYDEEDRYSGVLTKDGKVRHAVKAPKKMNYAAAAAKADAGSKGSPPGFASKSGDVKEAEKATATNEKKEKAKSPKKEAETKEDASEKKDKSKEIKSAEKETAAEKDKSADKEGEKTETKEKPKSKLNANAKSFTFNPSAKSFTPTFGGNFSAPAAPQQPRYMQPTPYMGPMGQPGMMMSPQYPGMRYPAQYPGMEQQATQAQPQQPQHAAQAAGAPAPAEDSTSPAPVGDEETTASQQQDDDASQQTAPQQPQVPVQYNVPPGAYMGPGMAMRPGYPPQFGSPQMQVPGGARYPMYPVQPGMATMMRGPNGAPYYPGPGGPVPYPPGAYVGQGMMDESDPNFRGRGGRGGGRRGGNRGRGGRGGRGRGGYNNYNGGNSGRNTPQNHQGNPGPDASAQEPQADTSESK